MKLAFFGVDGTSILGEDGYAQATSIYDDRGNWIKVTYLGADGNPIVGKEGSASLTRAYDKRGNGLRRLISARMEGHSSANRA